MPTAAMTHAQGLAGPSWPPMTEGSPKTLLPMTEFSTSPVRATRPMALGSAAPDVGQRLSNPASRMSGAPVMYRARSEAR